MASLRLGVQNGSFVHPGPIGRYHTQGLLFPGLLCRRLFSSHHKMFFLFKKIKSTCCSSNRLGFWLWVQTLGVMADTEMCFWILQCQSRESFQTRVALLQKCPAGDIGRSPSPITPA